MKKFTKIVATISDKRCDVDFIQSLYAAGLNVVRLNSAHLEREGIEKIVNNVRAVSPHIAILIDTKGPEIRTTAVDGGGEIAFSEGQKVTLVGDPERNTTADTISFNYPNIASVLKAGGHVLIDDGELDFRVDQVHGRQVALTALNDGLLGSRKSVNLPGVKIDLPSISERDRRNVAIAVDLKLDFIAHSFVRSEQDVFEMRDLINELGGDIKIISKIENQQGVDNIDRILAASYGIMIARGDLGIEVSLERIPGIQKRIIDKCILAHKPVVVATQMLHSMIENPRPTRAEVSDIANAVYQRTDALMLSGETAYGRYPVEAMETMTRIVREAERSLASLSSPIPHVEHDVTSFLARQAVATNSLLGTRAIITDSYTGRTARYVASYRGQFPTLAVCYHENVVRRLAISYGVVSTYHEHEDSSRAYLLSALQQLMDEGRLTQDDSIAYLGGGFGEGHGTTFLEINNVGEMMSNYHRYSLPNLEDVEQDS